MKIMLVLSRSNDAGKGLASLGFNVFVVALSRLGMPATGQGIVSNYEKNLFHSHGGML